MAWRGSGSASYAVSLSKFSTMIWCEKYHWNLNFCILNKIGKTKNRWLTFTSYGRAYALSLMEFRLKCVCSDLHSEIVFISPSDYNAKINSIEYRWTRWTETYSLSISDPSVTSFTTYVLYIFTKCVNCFNRVVSKCVAHMHRNQNYAIIDAFNQC